MNLNPVVLSIPIFFVLIGIELVVERLTHKQYYRLPDAIANMSCGITSQLAGLFLKILAVGVYQVLFEHFAIFTLEQTWLYWVALVLLVDFAYYWGHRMSHEVNVMWGGHVVHHQSEDYNLSVALRQSSFQTVWTFAFNLPIALLGFRTEDFILVAAFNLLYQFWIHTESIKKLPRWFEFIFNTPSHHRVHHGRNPKYIDKNHAGSLIIWDRMFGTFQAEEEHPTYGITKPINSWNAVYANFSHYVDMGNDLKRITKWRDKIRYIFSKPGWLPDELGGYRAAPEVNERTYHKYHTPSPLLLSLYVLFQYLICLGGTALFLFQQESFTIQVKMFIALLITITVVNCGVLFEHRKWAVYAEWLRIVVYPLLLVILVYMNNWSVWLYLIAGLYLLISLFWFQRVVKNENILRAVQ
jgi:alkylglycerol monooxygenase